MVPQSASARQSKETLLCLIQMLADRLSQQVNESEQRSRQLRDLAIQMTQAEERERRYLARILHDDLQQTLAAVSMRIDMAKAKTTGPELAEAFACLKELIAEAIATSRSLVSNLCPRALYEGNLASGLDWLAREARQRHGLEVTVSADPQAEPGTQEIRTILIRGVRELLLNTAKHAGVRKASVMAKRSVSWIRVVVEDRGVGFDPHELRDRPDEGFGLYSIRERVACLGGNLKLISAPGQGTRAIFVIPNDVHEAVPARVGPNAGHAAGATPQLHIQGVRA